MDFSWNGEHILKRGGVETDPKTGLQVTILGKSNREFIPFGHSTPTRIDIGSYFKLTMEDQTFFVKKSLATVTPGFYEFQNTAKAKKALEGLDFVRTVDMQLGYSDNYQSWYVSRWQDLESEGFFPMDSFLVHAPNDYGQFLPEEITDSPTEYEEVEELKLKRDQIIEKLQEAGIDITDMNANLFCNYKTKNFFLLDVTTRDTKERLNQP